MMRTSTTKPYLIALVCGSIVGVVLSIGILGVHHLVFATEFSLHTFGIAVRGGLFYGVVTSAFVLVGTIGFARKLDTRRGKALLIAMSFVSPIVGWILFGVVESLRASWMFFFTYPVIALIAGVLAGIFAAIAMFFMPSSEAHDEDAQQAENVFEAFDWSE